MGSNKLFDEFDRIDAVKGKSSARLGAVAERRESVACALAKCPPGSWIEIDEFFRFLKALDLDFTVARHQWKLYHLRGPLREFRLRGHHDWQLLQGRFIMATLFEYAATLGLIDVAYVSPQYGRNDFYDHWGADDFSSLSRYDGLKFIRLNPLGAWCLGIAKDYQPQHLGPRSFLAGPAKPRDRLVRRLPRPRRFALPGPRRRADLTGGLAARS